MPGYIEFKPNHNKILEILLYFSYREYGDLREQGISNILYMADCDHLNKYGRPITFDRYIATTTGPRAVTAWEILFNTKLYEREKLPFRTYTKFGEWNHPIVTQPTRKINDRLFSISDLDILNAVWAKYEKMSRKEMHDLTTETLAFRSMRYEDMIEESPLKEGLIEDLKATGLYIS